VATLHILRNLDATLCLEAMAGDDQLLLLQDAVLSPGPFACPVSVGVDDLKARGQKSDHAALNFDEIRDLMLAHDRAVLW